MNVATILTLVLSASVLAGGIELANDPATSGPGKFAAEEISREAKANGMTLEDDRKGTRVALTVGIDGEAAAQSYTIRVKNEDRRRIITVRGADAAGAMYGGQDVAEAVRVGTLETLRDSDIPAQTKEVAEDIANVRDWKPGSIDESKLKRTGIEAGFKD